MNCIYMAHGHKPNLGQKINGLIWATLLLLTFSPHAFCCAPCCAIIATHGPGLAGRIHTIADRRPAVPAWGHIRVKTPCYVGWWSEGGVLEGFPRLKMLSPGIRITQYIIKVLFTTVYISVTNPSLPPIYRILSYW